MQQPKPISRRYDDIIRNIENGIYQIPKFQRDFVWDKNKSAKLIESLLKGYPIGSFILWKTKERLKSLKKLGGEILKEIEDENPYFIETLTSDEIDDIEAEGFYQLGEKSEVMEVLFTQNFLLNSSPGLIKFIVDNVVIYDD